jgi:hypothetical protein
MFDGAQHSPAIWRPMVAAATFSRRMLMTGLRNAVLDKHVCEKFMRCVGGVDTDFDSGLPHKVPHPQPPPGDHGPDPDEPVDKTESGEEP